MLGQSCAYALATFKQKNTLLEFGKDHVLP